MEVVFKGTKDGLLVLLPDIPVDSALDAMIEKMEQNRAFFEGGTCPVIISGEIDASRMERLRERLRDEFGLPKVECIKRHAVTESRREPARFGALIQSESDALSIEGTIRNGQRVTYQGDLIVIGDANPGSQLVAGGNILVFGSLRGNVHAGAFGDESAFVVAFQLLPTQVRIAQHIARAPAGIKAPVCPEMARVRDGRIEIAPYLPAKAQSGGFR